MQKATGCCTFKQEYSGRVVSISSAASFDQIQDFLLCTAVEGGGVFLSPKKKATSCIKDMKTLNIDFLMLRVWLSSS